MAATDLVSFTIRDHTGDKKTVQFYIPTGMTLANIQAGVTAFAPVIDAVIDGVIESAQVTLALTLPGGLNDTPGDQTVHEGALLSFAAANTAYRHSIYIPSWLETGFVGNAVSSAGAFATLVADIISGLGTGGSELKPADRFGNDLTSSIEGVRKFRK